MVNAQSQAAQRKDLPLQPALLGAASEAVLRNVAQTFLSAVSPTFLSAGATQVRAHSTIAGFQVRPTPERAGDLETREACATPRRWRSCAVAFGALLTLQLCLCPALAAASSAPTATLENACLRFTLWPLDGRCELVDKHAGLTWRSPAAQPRLGRAQLYAHGNLRTLSLARCQCQKLGDTLVLLFRPIPEQPLSVLRVWVHALPDRPALDVSYQEDPELDIENISLFGDLFTASDSGRGYLAVPVREGLLIPADSGLAFTHHFDTYDYEGCHMAMFGVVQAGAAALVTWSDPYAALELTSTLTPSPSAPPRYSPAPGSLSSLGGEGRGDEAPTPQRRPVASAPRQRLTPALMLRKSARSFRIHLLGKGDYVTIAKAYRQVAWDQGWLVTWPEKLKSNPDRAKLFGAADFKLWSALDRRMNPESTHEDSLHVNWTFDEAAQVAEHLKRDLKLERVLFTLGGWVHRGYDNQHPDILPAAPECGGSAALTDCARRVLDLGYLFCLHDNYQDIYRDSPSWSESLVMKDSDGELVRGGRWAGGQAYLTCSEMALELAQRPQNMPAVRKLTGANAYFIDTTYAAPLQECYDFHHPLTRRDDLHWKQALSDYARGVFGIFGSECGREWAIPHSDFFEGLTGVSGQAFHNAALPANLGATVIPLFDLVYRDCIALYGKYGYDPQQAAEYVLRHISLARPLNYHGIPPHLYWKQSHPPRETEAPASGLDRALFTRADNGWAAGLHPLDRFVKNTCEILCPLNELTAQLPMTRHEFLTPDRKVERTVFGEGKAAVEIVVNAGATDYACASKLGGKLVLPPGGFLAEAPTFVAFSASNWGKVRYSTPTLFTLRSLDGKPLASSRQLQVYHAFGSDQIRVGKTVRTVTREGVFH